MGVSWTSWSVITPQPDAAIIILIAIRMSLRLNLRVSFYKFQTCRDLLGPHVRPHLPAAMFRTVGSRGDTENHVVRPTRSTALKEEITVESTVQYSTCEKASCIYCSCCGSQPLLLPSVANSQGSSNVRWMFHQYTRKSLTTRLQHSIMLPSAISSWECVAASCCGRKTCPVVQYCVQSRRTLDLADTCYAPNPATRTRPRA